MSNRYYILSDGEKFKNAWWSDDMDFEGSILCPKFPGHQRPGRRKNPLRIKLESPKIGDFIWTWYSECLITEKVATMFKEAGFTGYRLDPVIVTDVKGDNISNLPSLFEFVITGKGGFADKKSGIKVKSECIYCKDKNYIGFTKGLYIDESQWDGSDFFTVWPLPKYIIVTERVYNYIKKYKINNVKFINPQELKSVTEDGELAPGNYEDWLNNIQ